MNCNKSITCKSRILGLLMIALFLPVGKVIAQDANSASAFKQEQLEQIVAPIALYPDEVLTQIMMASTYPIEVVQAERWVKENSGLKGDELTKALESKSWDPSVKSLVNFPEVLKMMSEKLDWTEKLGDTFLSQKKEVMDSVQRLRKKAQEQGNLKTTEQQVVKEEQQDIIIEPANPEEIYVPSYDSTAYGTWPYPEYPPDYYYPPGYVEPSPLYFGTGIAAGAAWGYAWGHSDWHDGDVDVDVDRNLDTNRNINRDKYRNTGKFGPSGKGTWQHNPANRRGVAYRDRATAQRYNRGASASAIGSRQAYRGRAQTTGQKPIRSGAGQSDRFGTSAQRSAAAQRPQARQASSNLSNRGGAFQSMNSGSAARVSSNRGQMSRQSMPSRSRSSAPRSGGRGGRGGGRR